MTFKLPFGLKNGELVHISNVEKGLGCNCICPSCKHPLVARKGEKTLHHFAHHRGKECENGQQTALHLAAKKILEKHKKIVLPETYVEVWRKTSPDWRISKELLVNLDEVKLENHQKGIIPDILAYVQGKPLMIEITVTHKTGVEKIEKARKQGISILEINLENFERNFSIEDLENEIIYNIYNKKWLLNIKAEKFKKIAYAVSERKIFKGEKTTPYCPLGLKGWIKTNTTSNMSWMQWRKFSWNEHCSNCEFCVDIQHETVSGIHDKNVFPKLRKTEVFCLGKNQIKNLNDLFIFLNRN